MKLKKVKIAKDQHIIRHYPISMEEAKKIVEENNTKTGKEFVDEIYRKLGMKRE